MSEKTKARQRQSREGRLQAALRENLKRRKAQARGRQVAATENAAAEPTENRENSDPKDDS
jgi:hypothetical protein